MEDAKMSLRSGSSSSKAVAVSAGEAHTLALTGDGCVYSWGRGMFGRLGTGKETDELFPVRVEFKSNELVEKRLKFVGIAAGAYHSLALADDGSVWCWGYNIFGQLGFNGENSLVPWLLELGSSDSLKDESERTRKTPLKLCSIEAGGMMSLAIDNYGTLWIWGNCPPQNNTDHGNFSLVHISTPIPVQVLHGRTVIKVACGNEHIVALVAPKESHEDDHGVICFSWGANTHGQLGLGHIESRSQPQIIESFDHESTSVVYDVACGAYHTALLSRKKSINKTLKSFCWTFGRGDNGQLGLGTTQNASSPKCVFSKDMVLVSVDCGLFHTSVVSIDGDVWSWGMENGLGLCPDASFTRADTGDAISPVMIQCSGPHSPKFMNPIQVACGAAHTVLVSNNGYNLWSWGRGKSGVLGNGNTLDCYTPTPVMWAPLFDDFKGEEKEDGTIIKKENTDENEKKLRMAMEEMTLLRSKLSIMEKYASILHGSIFGKRFEENDIPISLKNSGNFDIAKEWDNMLELADRSKLVGLEMFYRNMLAGVKDKIMKKRIKEIVNECVHSSPALKKSRKKEELISISK